MPDRPKTDLLGAVLIALSALQFGIVVVAAKRATTFGLAAWWILCLRFALASVILFAVLAALRRPFLAAPGERLPVFLLGIAGYAVEATFFFLALEHGNASTVTLLFFTYPALVAAGNMLLGRGAPGWLLGGALVAAVTGAALVIGSSGGLAIDAAGVGLALASAATVSGYLLGADLALQRTNSFTASAWVSGGAAVGLGLLSASTGRLEAPAGLDQWTPILLMGLFTAGAFVCLLAGLRLLGPVRTAVIGSAEPVAGVGLSALFLHEEIRPLVVVGGVLILAGAVAAALARRPAPGVPEPAMPFEPPAP